jgi:hypothetical protein
MKPFSPSSGRKTFSALNKAINTLALILFLALVLLYISNFFQNERREAVVNNMHLRVSGPQKQFSISNNDLLKDVNIPQSQKGYKLELDQLNNQINIEVLDSTWKLGKTIIDSLSLQPIGSDRTVTNLNIAIVSDSNKLSQIIMLRPMNNQVKSENSLMSNLPILLTLLLIGGGIIVFKAGLLIKKFRATPAKGTEGNAEKRTIAEKNGANIISGKNEEEADQNDEARIEKMLEKIKSNNRINFNELYSIANKSISDNISYLQNEIQSRHIIEDIVSKFEQDIRNMSNSVEPITSSRLKTELQKIKDICINSHQEKEESSTKLDALRKVIEANLNLNKKLVESKHLAAELDAIQELRNKGKEFDELIKKLKLKSSKPKAIEEYIEKELSEIKNALRERDQSLNNCNTQIQNLKHAISQFETSIATLTKEKEDFFKKGGEREVLSQKLLDIGYQFEEDVLRSNATTLSAADYRQFILPKLLELSFLTIDFLKWSKNKQSNIDNIEIIGKSENGKIKLSAVRNEIIASEIDYGKYESSINKLIPILLGADVPEGSLKTAETPKVFINGWLLEIKPA